jgi:type II secretory pathway pseudopilin PulG
MKGTSTLRRRSEGGETLVEILISVVIIGLVVGAIFATYTAAATSSKSQRDFVTADAELRNYAEALHAAAENCAAGDPLSPTPPGPYALTAIDVETNGAPACPAATAVARIDISVTLPKPALPQKLTTYVRTP